jgi:hypothetical protein
MILYALISRAYLSFYILKKKHIEMKLLIKSTNSVNWCWVLEYHTSSGNNKKYYLRVPSIPLDRSKVI